MPRNPVFAMRIVTYALAASIFLRPASAAAESVKLKCAVAGTEWLISLSEEANTATYVVDGKELGAKPAEFHPDHVTAEFGDLSHVTIDRNSLKFTLGGSHINPITYAVEQDKTIEGQCEVMKTAF